MPTPPRRWLVGLTGAFALRTVLATALLVLIGAPSARGHATDPPELLGNTTVVHACVSARGGMVQLVDATTEACRFGATAQHWGRVGEPGAQGLPGAPGADGTGTMLLVAGLCNPLQAGPGGGIARFIRPGSCGSLGIVLPRTGVLSDWHVWMSLSGPTDSPITLSHRINTVAEQVICSRTGLVTIPCLDTPVSVQAGDLLELVVTLDNSSGAEDLVVVDLTVTFILAPTPAP